jgi:small subunit ribosomal protein S17
VRNRDGTKKHGASTPPDREPRGRRKTAIGYVVSDKMEKTIVVELEDRKMHPLYGKIIRPPRRSRRTTRTATPASATASR